MYPSGLFREVQVVAVFLGGQQRFGLLFKGREGCKVRGHSVPFASYD
jgi:hypothetical protein